MDNERPIEKLLRRYAKKRRDEASAPPELHSATRRLLHGEVSRRFQRKRSAHAASAETSARWWPRLVYGLCVVAAVALVSALLVSALTGSRPQSLEMASAGKSRNEEPADRAIAGGKDESTLSRMVPESLAPPSLPDAGLKPAKGMDDFGAAITNEAVLAYAAARPSDGVLLPAAQEGGSLRGVLADSEVITAAAVSTPQSGLDKESTSRYGLGAGPEATTGLPLALNERQAPTAGTLKVADQVRRGPYVQARAMARFSNMDKTGAKAVVLVSFQVEQAGNELRVIDSDGSTYAGRFVVAPYQPEAEKELSVKTEEMTPAAQNAARKAFDSVSSSDSFAQNAFFRVSGTNRTLRQQVVFTGNFVTLTNAVQPQMSQSGGLKEAQVIRGQQLYPLQLNNSIIVGRAQLEKNVEIEVNAVPVRQ